MVIEYNRIVCNLCSYVHTCESLRTTINCFDCQYSLSCVQTKHFGDNHCKTTSKKWYAANLPSKDNTCILVEQLLMDIRANSEIFVPTTGYTAEELDITALRTVVCPRCNENTAGIEWNYIENGFRVRNLKCSFCNINASQEL